MPKLHHTIRRGKMLTLRLNEEEHERLAALSRHYALSVSETLRMLVVVDARRTKADVEVQP
jgi:predicted DNA-binding protein